MRHDVAIIGAGPCGLAVAARLREKAPSALFTDAEHARYWRKHSANSTIEKEAKEARKTCRSLGSGADDFEPPSVIIFDERSDKWMSSWKQKFAKLQIEHLRSPLFFHPDPQDRDGLLAFSHFQNRSAELKEITNVVGREVSKHAKKKGRKSRTPTRTARHLHLDGRDRNDYYTPSSELFHDFCESVSRRYHLENSVCHARISSISYDFMNSTTDSLRQFAITTSTGDVYFSQTVVIATGTDTRPSIPRSFDHMLRRNPCGSACHIFDPTHSNTCVSRCLETKLQQKVPTNVVIVGGGLTSAQVADLLLKSGIWQVTLLVRGRLKVKHFDVDLAWVSKLRNREMAAFWSADSDRERFEMLKEARNGGSITPPYEKILRQWERKGRLRILDHSSLDPQSTEWDDQSLTWNIKVQDTKHECPNERECSAVLSLPLVDHIIFATGAIPDVATIDCLNHIRSTIPIETIHGLPVLNHDLMWSDDVPIFVTGALAGLRLGPGAGNLAGARLGAERIAWGIEAFLGAQQQRRQGSSTSSASGLPNTLNGSTRHPIQSSKGSWSDSGYSSDSRESIFDQTAPAQDAGAKQYNEFTGGFNNQFQSLALLDDR